jgi:cyclophilin family peptidyl-prolyl cis-trans isomerase
MSRLNPPGPGRRASAVALLTAAILPSIVLAQVQNTYRLSTTLGNIDVTLRSDLAPRTVANFLGYAASGAYDASLIHRSVPGFVIQGGGYTLNDGEIYSIVEKAPVAGEFRLPNTRGTIAMALSTGPNSATSEWFFNLTDNSSLLDGTADGGPFTAFGQVCNAASLAVMDAIGGAEVINAGGPFSELPVVNFTSGVLVPSNFILVNSITPLSLGISSAAYNGSTLSIPVLHIGGATYSGVVLTLGHIVSGPAGSSPGSCSDSHDPSGLDLDIAQVTYGSATYFNVVASAGTLVSIGGVSGADTYDGKTLAIPYVQLDGGPTYRNVVVTIAGILGIGGGMPAAPQDQYSSAKRQLFIPAVQYGGKVYTNVTATVGSIVTGGP